MCKKLYELVLISIASLYKVNIYYAIVYIFCLCIYLHYLSYFTYKNHQIKFDPMLLNIITASALSSGSPFIQASTLILGSPVSPASPAQLAWVALLSREAPLSWEAQLARLAQPS